LTLITKHWIATLLPCQPPPEFQMQIFLAVALSTFVSEDLTCVGTGLLIQRGQIGVTTGILACTLGIFVGDVGLWAIGRLFGTAALSWPWTARRLQNHTLREMRAWLDRHAAGAIVGSRFLPGTRFALYVISGVLRVPLAVAVVHAPYASSSTVAASGEIVVAS